MKRFLHSLASSAMLRKAALHPFPETSYAPRQAMDHPPRGPEAVVGTSRPQQVASEPVPMAESESPHTSRTRQARRSARDALVPYEPLLPVREMKESTAEAPMPPRRRHEPTAMHDSDRANRSEERVSSSFIPQADNTSVVSQSHAVGQLRPFVSPAEAQPLVASRRPLAGVQPFSARHHQEVRGADDIQINIGRIEVVAVAPPVPRSTPAPARKGMSLDDYLNRCNGRTG